MDFLAKTKASHMVKAFSLILLISFIFVSAALADSSNLNENSELESIENLSILNGLSDEFEGFGSVRPKSYGRGATKYYLYEPNNPTSDTAPVIVFIHGFTATMPMTYQGWIDHLVDQGYIVIYSVYQAFMMALPIGFPEDTVTAVQNAFEELQTGDHVKPDPDKFAVVGHSMGGVLAADVAARAAEAGLPPVKAIMSVQPGKVPFPKLDDLSGLSPDTLLLCVVGSMDFIVGDKDAKRIFESVPQIPEENKAFVEMKGASHFAPVCLSGLMADRLDTFLWESFDALCNRAFYGEN